MSIELKMEPRVVPMSWKQFCKRRPAYSIALDGYVNDGPKKDITAPKANFDHHRRVSRLETRATCAQVLMAVHMGLFELFKKGNEPHALIYSNDCDQDVCASWTILNNHKLVEKEINSRLNKLVEVEDKLDTTAGAYPYPDSLDFLEELAWVFEPYTQFKMSGGLDKRKASEFSNVVYDVEKRILKHIDDKGSSVPLDTRYKVLGNGNGWSIVEEIGAQARTGIFSDGIKAYLSVRRRTDGNWQYAICRMSEFILFPIPEILKQLKIAEGIKKRDQWGGTPTVICNPRIKGSKLIPDEVIKIIKERVPD